MQFCTTCKIPGFISFVAVVIHVYAVNNSELVFTFSIQMFPPPLSLSVRLYIVIQFPSFVLLLFSSWLNCVGITLNISNVMLPVTNVLFICCAYTLLVSLCYTSCNAVG